MNNIIASGTGNGSNFVKAFKIFFVRLMNIVPTGSGNEYIQILSDVHPSDEVSSSTPDSKNEERQPN